MKLFKSEDQLPSVDENKHSQVVTLIDETTALESSLVENNTLNELENVGKRSNEITQQSVLKSIFFGAKNVKDLAENDIVISKVIKSILDWLLMVTSAEALRREEYEDLTEQMLRFDEDVTVQLEMQVKFKRAFEQLQAKQNEQSKMIHQLANLQRYLVVSSMISVISLIVAVIAIVN